MRTTNFPRKCGSAAMVLALCCCPDGQGSEPLEPERSVLAYVGTYTGAKSKGIYATWFNSRTGSFSNAELAAEVTNPAFLAVHPNRRWLYAVNEMESFNGKRAGAVSAFGIDHASGKLTLLNQQPSGGTGPCHLSVDKSGRCLLVANYGSGSVAAFKIAADGRLSEAVTTIQNQGSSVNRQRQSGPHAHFIVPDPENRFVLACDLGLDQVLVWKFHPAKALLSAHEPMASSLEPGSGPRHLTFHPRGRFAYVLNELTSSLATFAYNPKSGKLTALRTVSTLPQGFDGKNSGAEVQVHPSGKYVYSSNRGDDSIAIFAVDTNTGIASYVGCEKTLGKTPRHFAVDSTGQWLIAENQDSDNIVTFRIDERDGSLKPTGLQLKVGMPACLVFVPAKR